MYLFHMAGEARERKLYTWLVVSEKRMWNLYVSQLVLLSEKAGEKGTCVQDQITVNVTKVSAHYRECC